MALMIIDNCWNLARELRVFIRNCTDRRYHSLRVGTSDLLRNRLFLWQATVFYVFFINFHENQEVCRSPVIVSWYRPDRCSEYVSELIVVTYVLLSSEVDSKMSSCNRCFWTSELTIIIVLTRDENAVIPIPKGLELLWRRYLAVDTRNVRALPKMAKLEIKSKVIAHTTNNDCCKFVVIVIIIIINIFVVYHFTVWRGVPSYFIAKSRCWHVRTLSHSYWTSAQVDWSTICIVVHGSKRWRFVTYKQRR